MLRSVAYCYFSKENACPTNRSSAMLKNHIYEQLPAALRRLRKLLRRNLLLTIAKMRITKEDGALLSSIVEQEVGRILSSNRTAAPPACNKSEDNCRNGELAVTGSEPILGRRKNGIPEIWLVPFPFP